MKPAKFAQQNLVFAEDQPEYQPLPAYRDEAGQVITCWELSWRERLALFLTGRLWLRQLTFNHPLQPQAPSVESPFNV